MKAKMTSIAITFLMFFGAYACSEKAFANETYTIKNETKEMSFSYPKNSINDIEIIQEANLPSYKILLVRNPNDGYPFLRIIDMLSDGSFFLDSNSLPPNTYIEWVDTETIALFDGQHDLYIKKSDRFGWALVGVNDFEFGYDFVYGGNYYYSNVGYTYGDHPYGCSISDVDFFTIPSSEEDMIGMLKQEEWGHILTSSGCSVLYDSLDDSSSQPLILYNGTPVKIIEKVSEWARVQIGDLLCGFIREEDIKRGGFIAENESCFPQLFFTPGAALYLLPDRKSDQRCAATNIDDLVVGKLDDWYLVITLDGMSGFINKDDLLYEE